MPGLAELVNVSTSLTGLTVERDVQYGPSHRQCLDVYRPTGAHGLPVVVWFYGGSWKTGRRQDYRFVAAALARTGCVVVVPDYRLFPEVVFPGFIEDGASAVSCARQHADTWGGDPARVFAAGHSAGAYIAAMLALDARFGVRALLAGAVGIGGPYDFLPILDADIQPIFAAEAAARATQPISYVDGHNAPLLLLHGQLDRVCYPRNSIALATRIRAAGGLVMLKTYPLLAHIGIVTAFLPWLRWRAPVLRDVADFVHRTWAAPPPRAIDRAA